MLPSIFRENLFDDFFDDFPFFNDRGSEKAYGHHAANLMKTDIRESDSAYTLEIDLPGLRKEDVKVELENGYLTIRAVKQANNDEKSNGRYIRRERFVGSCMRSFYVGEEITQEEIRGEFKHGILTLTIPKREARPAVNQKKYIAIEG